MNNQNPIINTEPTIKGVSPDNASARRNAAARQSFTRFTGNIADGAARAMNYANPLTLVKSTWDAAGQLPDAMAAYDADYTRRVREDLYGAPQTQNQPEVQTQYDTPRPKTRTKTQARAPGLEMKSEPMHPVDVSKYDYSTGKALDYGDKQQHKRDQSVYDGASPYHNVDVTPSNWRSPGKKYNDLDRSQIVYDDTGAAYFDNTFMRKRYKGSHRPRTEQQRVLEGKQAHNRVLRGIDAQNGIFHPYKSSAPSAKAQQQRFDNDLDLRKHALNVQKRQDTLGQGNYKARYSDVLDDNFNIVGSRFDGSFNGATGQFIPAGQGQSPVRPSTKSRQPTMEASPQEILDLQRGYQVAKSRGSKEVMDEFNYILSLYGMTLEDLGLEVGGIE